MTEATPVAMEVWLAAKRDFHAVDFGFDRDQAAAAVIATALADMQRRVEALEEALVLAANRLDVCVVDAIADGNERRRCAYTGWAEDARAALSAIPDERAAGIREGLEMAAKVAEDCTDVDYGFPHITIAAAIRALKDSHPTPDAV